jgi:hypothetical protein
MAHYKLPALALLLLVGIKMSHECIVPAAGSGPMANNINKTLSCGAERDTIAFDALAFLSGTLGTDTAIPGGKVADSFGYQYFRDNDPNGHSTVFQTAITRNVMSILDSAQRAKLIALAYAQNDTSAAVAFKRFELIEAFRRLSEGDIPAGSSGLDKGSVMQVSADIYAIDGQLTYDRAVLYASIINAFTVTQYTYLDNLAGTTTSTWPVPVEVPELKGLPAYIKSRVVGYSGDLFTWFAGNVDSDTYFAPERYALTRTVDAHKR